MPKFVSLKYKNVQSVGNHPITIDLTRNQTTLVGGNNGSGKSTMGFALTYGLYGKFPNGAKLSDAINSVNKKNLLVEVKFTARGSEYLVVRGEKPKKFEIYKDDELVDQSASARDYQKILDSILGIDYQLFTQVVMLNKEQYEPFMQLTAAKRRAVIENILGISIFKHMNDVAKEKYKEAERELTSHERTYDTYDTKIESKNELIEEIQSNIDNKEAEIKESIKTEKKLLKGCLDEIDKLNIKIEDIDYSRLSKVKDSMSELSKIAVEFEHNIKSGDQTVKFFSENDDCPTCSQQIPESLKNLKVSETQYKIQELRTAASELSEQYEALQEEKKALVELQSLESDLRSNLRSLEREANIYVKNIERLEEKLNTGSDDSERLKQAKQDLDDLIKERNDVKQSIEDSKNKVQTLMRMSNVLKDDGVKAIIIKEYIDLINRKVNEYLNAMGFYINMVLDENFNESFKALHKENFTMSNLSTGQKTRVNLAIWLALLEVASIKNSVVSNVLFLDEILENLDANGVQDFMRLCKEMLTDKNVFVVTQRFDEFQDYFRSSIQFKLNEGFTEIL